MYVCVYIHTYIHTNVQKVDQNTALNDTCVNLLTANATKVGDALYAVCTGNAFQAIKKYT